LNARYSARRSRPFFRADLTSAQNSRLSTDSALRVLDAMKPAEEKTRSDAADVACAAGQQHADDVREVRVVHLVLAPPLQ
jgi:hypothetical protein